jgi:hypothetical protein
VSYIYSILGGRVRVGLSVNYNLTLLTEYEIMLVSLMDRAIQAVHKFTS